MHELAHLCGAHAQLLQFGRALSVSPGSVEHGRRVVVACQLAHFGHRSLVCRWVGCGQMAHILRDHVVKAPVLCLRSIAVQRLQNARSRFGERVGELCEPSAPTGDGDYLRVEETCEHGWHGVCLGEAVAHHKYGETHEILSLNSGMPAVVEGPAVRSALNSCSLNGKGRRRNYRCRPKNRRAGDGSRFATVR